jgi:GDP-4-dehydro-6-deoxy-D-mannose reductase
LAALLSTDTNIQAAGLDIAEAAPVDAPLHHYFQADISNFDEIARAVKDFRPDRIFHLAGASGGSSASAVQSSPLRAFQVNTSGALHILESVRRFAPDCRVLLVGSAAEYGPLSESDVPVRESHPCRPQGCYGVSKFAATLAGQEYARSFGLKVVIARPFNIIGPGMPPDLVIGALVHRAKEALAASNEPIVHSGDLSSKRDFVAVEDVVRAYVHLINSDAWGEIFNICSGQAHTVQEAAELLFSHSPYPITIKIDKSLARSSASSVYGSFEKASRAIQYRPTINLDSSLAAVWRAAFAT